MIVKPRESKMSSKDEQITTKTQMHLIMLIGGIIIGTRSLWAQSFIIEHGQDLG